MLEIKRDLIIIKIIKWSIYHEGIISVYVPDKRDPKYMEQKLTELKGETKNLKIIVGDFSIPLYIINRIREKI